MEQDPEPLTIWAIRPTARADADILAASAYFATTASIEIARDWLRGIREEIAKLAQLPTRWPAAEEDKLFREQVRRMLYRRTPSGPAYQVLFVLRQNDDDAPTVTILHPALGAEADDAEGSTGD